MPVNLKKGQKVDLSKAHKGLDKIQIGLGWDVNKYDGQDDFDLDATVFTLGESDKVRSDADFIFYNNLVGAGGSVKHLGDNTTGDGDSDDEQIEVTLSTIPGRSQSSLCNHHPRCAGT